MNKQKKYIVSWYYYYTYSSGRARGHEYPDNHFENQNTQHASNIKSSPRTTHTARQNYPSKARNC
jgi:hypothetical protein